MPQSLTNFLASRMTEISFTVATIFMLFGGDYLTDKLIIKKIRKHNPVVRTGLFLAYVLVALPLLTVGFARLLSYVVLEPLRSYLWAVLLAVFVLCAVLLSVKYRMKLF